jgi:prevent-host-death family protein
MARIPVPMDQFNVAEAKARFSELIDEAAKGKTIVIAKSGTPVAKIVPLEAERKKIKFGLMKGQIWIANDFDDPLPDDLLAALTDSDK